VIYCLKGVKCFLSLSSFHRPLRPSLSPLPPTWHLQLQRGQTFRQHRGSHDARGRGRGSGGRESGHGGEGDIERAEGGSADG